MTKLLFKDTLITKVTVPKNHIAPIRTIYFCNYTVLCKINNSSQKEKQFKMKTHLHNIMKKLFVLGILIIMTMIYPQHTYAQQQSVGINNASPDPSAAIDAQSGIGISQGILFPRVNLTTPAFAFPSPGPATHLLLINTSSTFGKGIGLYRNSGTAATPAWKKLLEDGEAWSIFGNTGTVAGTNFIGTTDNVDFVMKRNSSNFATQFLQLTGSGLGISATSPTDNTTSGKSIFFGQAGNVTGTSGLDIGIDQDNNSTASKFRVIKDGGTNLLAVAEVGTIGLGATEDVGTSGQVLTSTGVGSAAIWQTPYGGNIQYVVGSSDISINTTTFTDMASMSITFTPKHSVVFVNFSAAGYTTSPGDAGTYVDLRLQTIIGATTTTVGGTTSMTSDFDFDDVYGVTWSTSWNAHFTMFPITGLTIGTPLTIKVQWARGGNAPGTVVNNASTSKNDSHRSLVIFD